MKRYGFIVDSFNPFNLNHLKAGIDAFRKYHLDKVFYIPIYDKDETISRSNKIRMIRHYISSYRKLELFADSLDCFIKIFNRNKNYELLLINELNSGFSIENINTVYTDYSFESEKVRTGDFSSIDMWQRRYISDNYLYQYTIAETVTGEKRWSHVQSVTQLAVEIALETNIDLQKARTAALFHDCAKYFDEKKTAFYDSFYTTENELGYNYAVRHQSCGYALMRKYFKFTDKDILNAVRHHTTGDYNNALARLIFVADKLDRSRGYDSEKEIQLCKNDLKKGFETVFNQQQEYLRKTGVI